MINIGFQLNYIIRDIVGQIDKYYVRDYGGNADDSSNKPIELEQYLKQCSNFKSKKEIEAILYEDYAYEIFGCAKVREKNIDKKLTLWHGELNDKSDETINFGLFGLREKKVAVPSSLFFIAKLGLRPKSVYFPDDGKEMWNYYDIIVTTDKNVIESKPEGKTVIYINLFNDDDLAKKCDFVYQTTEEMLSDKDFYDKIIKKTT